MGNYLSEAELKRTAPAETTSFRGPMPTQIVSNGEFVPIPQTREQQRVEARVKELAATLAPKHGMSRRRFLASSAGMAAALLAMNEVFGHIFDVSGAEAAEPGMADARAKSLARQFIVDCQTHFIRDDFKAIGLTDFAKWAKSHGNPQLEGETGLDRFKFGNYVKEIFVDSDTKVALLSGTPSETAEFEALGNHQIIAARNSINAVAGSRRMLGHAIIRPGKPDWIAEQVIKAIEAPKSKRPDSWKGYTIGDPFQAAPSACWRLDDDKLMGEFYDRILKAGITTVCIHKGILPPDYATRFANIWDHATVWDVAQAARAWPRINFVIYHSALRPFLEPSPEATLKEFDETGRLPWASDLAEIPKRYGVKNVYAEIGTAFANYAVAAPRLAAALLGILIKGMGADHVLWGTDSVWYGSPQWQIEAFRRLTMPQDLAKKYGFASLGPANGPVKRAIFGENAARLYKLRVNTALGALSNDKIAGMKTEYVRLGNLPSNTRYGYVASTKA